MPKEWLLVPGARLQSRCEDLPKRQESPILPLRLPWIGQLGGDDGALQREEADDSEDADEALWEVRSLLPG